MARGVARDGQSEKEIVSIFSSHITQMTCIVIDEIIFTTLSI